MHRSLIRRVALTVALLPATLFCGACARTELSTKVDSDLTRLQATISEARRLGAEQCAFEELVAAESEVELARMEYNREFLWAAQDHVQAAESAASAALEKSQECLVDRDGDGIRDLADDCPDQPETFNGFKDDDGCPDAIPRRAVMLDDKIEILEPVLFMGGESVLAAESLPVLDDVALLLRQNATRVRIEGHVADLGDPGRAMALSEQRAKAVRSYLVRRGIAPEMLSAVGKGSTVPIASNQTDRGREVNTRIEFMVEGK